MLPFPLWRASEEADCRIRSQASPWKYRAASSRIKSSQSPDMDGMPRRRPPDSMPSRPLAASGLRRIEEPQADLECQSRRRSEI